MIIHRNLFPIVNNQQHHALTTRQIRYLHDHFNSNNRLISIDAFFKILNYNDSTFWDNLTKSLPFLSSRSRLNIEYAKIFKIATTLVNHTADNIFTFDNFECNNSNFYHFLGLNLGEIDTYNIFNTLNQTAFFKNNNKAVDYIEIITKINASNIKHFDMKTYEK